jgi:hypothetical protein
VDSTISALEVTSVLKKVMSRDKEGFKRGPPLKSGVNDGGEFVDLGTEEMSTLFLESMYTCFS